MSLTSDAILVKLFLSSKYSNSKEKLLWECKIGHCFEMSLHDVQRGFWCTQCSGKYNFKSDEEINHFLVKKRGSANLRKRKYKISEKIEVTCVNGHTWRVSLFNLFKNNSWCPQCNFYRGEEICRTIFEKLTEKNIRVDIDDRNESIGKRIRESEKEWIRYVLVIGDKEVNSENLSVRDRTQSDVRDIPFDDFINEIQTQNQGKPNSTLNLPPLLSKRPIIQV